MSSSHTNLTSFLNSPTKSAPIIYEDHSANHRENAQIPHKGVFSDITNKQFTSQQSDNKQNQIKRKRNQYVKITTDMETDMIEVMVQEQLYSQIDNENNRLDKLRSITVTFQELYPKQLADLSYRRLSNLAKVSLSKGAELFEKRRLQLEEHGIEMVLNRHEQAQLDLFIQKRVYSIVFEIMNLDKGVKDDAQKSKQTIIHRLAEYQKLMRTDPKDMIAEKVIEVVAEMLDIPPKLIFNEKMASLQKKLESKIEKIDNVPVAVPMNTVVEPSFMGAYRVRFQSIESQVNALRERVQFIEAERQRAIQERTVLAQQISEFMQEIDRTMT